MCASISHARVSRLGSLRVIMSLASFWILSVTQVDELKDPGAMQDRIYDFLLTRCPIGSQYGQYTRNRPIWQNLPAETRELWGLLGVI